MRSIVMVMVVAHRLVQAGWGLHVGVQMGLQVMLQYNIMPGARQPAGFGLVCPARLLRKPTPLPIIAPVLIRFVHDRTKPAGRLYRRGAARIDACRRWHVRAGLRGRWF